MNKADFKTGKSKLDLQIESVNNESKYKEGISFYCSKRQQYLFIPKTKIIASK